MRRKYQCPCCGYYTVDDEYDICSVCFWEDDHVQSREPNVWGGANGPNLITARMNYKEFGASSQCLLSYCREPLEKEKNGIPYPYFQRYYYDDQKKILYSRGFRGKLYVFSDRYGSAFDSPLREGNKKYRLITTRIAVGDDNARRWRKVIKKGVREYVYPWRTDPDFDLEDDNEVFNMVLDRCKTKYHKRDKQVRRLSFAEYVKKIATRDFKDGILALNDEQLRDFEEACGCSVFDVLEMDDDDCAAVYKKVCEASETDERYKDLPETIQGGWSSLCWEVPDWMANWG